MKPQNVHVGHYNDVVKLYHDESDRAAAILAGSFVEHHLAVFLKAFLVEDPEIDELFHGFGPLSTFSQRISMSAAMGLISKPIRNELRAIKDIRNHFAHHPVEATFDDPDLDKPFNKLPISSDPIFNPKGDGPLKDRKLIYLFSVSGIVVSFHNAIANKRNATPAATEDFKTLHKTDNVDVNLASYDALTAPESEDET